MPTTDIILEVTGLKKYYPVRKGIFRRMVAEVKAVDGVSFSIREGEVFALVGESGCGKTTVGRCILRLIKPTGGDVFFLQRNGPTSSEVEKISVSQASHKRMKSMRRDMQIIYQDPNSSLNPRMRVGALIGEPLFIHKVGTTSTRREMVGYLLAAVGMNPEHQNRYPHQFSGGQRQRIAIARALALKPRLIICDEPVSALDVSIQAQVLQLLKDLQKGFRLTYLFISHDLAVVKYITDRVAVMYLGRIVESAKTADLFRQPKHPYTEALISAVPIPNPDLNRKRILLAGEVPSPSVPPSGCHFHPRCRYTQKICKTDSPINHDLGDDHFVSCHFGGSLDLNPIPQRKGTGAEDFLQDIPPEKA
jgi:peptide/nickel transport system ATP-binding protein